MDEKRKRRKRPNDMEDFDDDFPDEGKKKKCDSDMETDSEDGNKNSKKAS